MDTVIVGHIEMNLKAVNKMTKKKFVKLYKSEFKNTEGAFEELQMKLGKK